MRKWPGPHGEVGHPEVEQLLPGVCVIQRVDPRKVISQPGLERAVQQVFDCEVLRVVAPGRLSNT